ncbi:MAG: class I SAM-dependent methyltransferase [Dehalococcoidia bacterium]
MTTDTLNAAEAEAFAGTMLNTLNSAAVTLMISIGHQTGLFDTMATLPPATSNQIATAAGLNERYVREWLGAMVTGGIVEAQADQATYRLPPERAACLTRAAGPNNLASLMQFPPLLGTVEEGIVESFRKGGGLPYSAYPRFHALMAEFSAQTNDAALIDVILPLVPGLPERLQAGINVADIGCGAGHAINLMARTFPASRFTGYDFSGQAIAAGQAEAKEWGLTNVELAVQDVAALDAHNAYDLITAFDAIHDQAHPATVLQNIYTALKPGGTCLIVDIAASSNVADNRDHPLGSYLYTVSTMHCMTVSLALGGEGLGTVWGEQKARQMLAEASFTGVEVKRVEGDIINNYYICTKA